MAEEVAIDLTIKTGDAEKNATSLKAKLRELKQELAGLDEGSEAFNKIAEEAGKVQDKIGDLNSRVNNLASDTRKLDVVVGVAQGIAGGFAAAQGAAALFGAESEDLNKALLKVQGSVALLNGVQQIANTLNKDSAVMTALNTAAQAAYTFVVGTSTGALKLFRIALALTGIGLVVIAIGALIANWDKLTTAISGSNDALDANIAKTKESITEMKAQQVELQKQLDEGRLKEIAALEDIKRIREAQGLETVEIDKRIREARLRNGENETALNIAEQKRETDLLIEEYKTRAKREAAAEKERLQAIEDAKKEKENEIKELRKEYEEEEKAIELQRVHQNIADEAALEQSRLDEIARINKEAADHAAEATAEQARLDQAALDAKLLRAQINQTALQSLSSNGLALSRTLATLVFKDAEKQAKAMKAIAIVELAINTAKSISNAITGATASATATGPGAVVATPLFIASQIVAVLAAAAQAAAILATPVPSASAAIPSGADTSAITDTNGAPTVPQTPQSIPIPQQVFVTETDITGVQGQVQVIEHLGKIQ